MAGRRWTVAELDRLRACLRHQPQPINWREIAATVGERTPGACNQMAEILHLFTPRPHVPRGRGSKFERILMTLNGQGRNDRQIAEITGANRTVVSRHRRRLRLLANIMNADQRQVCARTWFKPGVLNGTAAKFFCPRLGITRINRRRKGGRHEDVRKIKVRMDGPPGKRWMPYARFRWEQLHGPLPAGYVVVHRNGRSLDDSDANLLAIPRRELPAHQSRIRPRMEPRRRAACSRASRERWRIYREIKAQHDGRVAERARYD